MKSKKLIATTAALAALAAIPTVAQANTASTTQTVQRGFSRVIHNRGRLSGYDVTSVKVRCANDGGGDYSCYGVWTAWQGAHGAKASIYINVTPNGWKTVGNARVLSQW
jgi:hypothetical protein